MGNGLGNAPPGRATKSSGAWATLASVRPTEYVREQLAPSRAAGAPFSEAWAAALASIPASGNARGDAEWLDALAGTVDAWRRAYARLEPTPHDARRGPRRVRLNDGEVLGRHAGSQFTEQPESADGDEHEPKQGTVRDPSTARQRVDDRPCAKQDNDHDEN